MAFHITFAIELKIFYFFFSGRVVAGWEEKRILKNAGLHRDS